MVEQEKKLSAWIESFMSLKPEIRASIVEIEFRAATTEFEPSKGQEDPRCIRSNPKAREVISQWKKSNAEDALRVNATASSSEVTPATGGAPASSAPTPTPSEAPVTAPAAETIQAPEVSRGPASQKKSPSAVGRKKRACVYYDRANSNDDIGILHAPMLQSLLGAFRQWSSDLRSMIDYQSGDLKSCDAVFYIASNYSLEPVESFYRELVQFSKTGSVAWMNYKVKNFIKAYNEMAISREEAPLGFDVGRIEQPLIEPSVTSGDPGFFRYFKYNGEIFEKAATWNDISNKFSSNPELNIIEIKNREKAKELSTAVHSKEKRESPYVVMQKTASGGIWYIADLPLAFVDYGSPYFIFCDLLWDILKETPPSGPRSALVRIEDVSPNTNQGWLRWAIDYLADRHIPFSIAVIPYYSNIFPDRIEGGRIVWRPAYDFPEFIGSMRYAKARGANFVFHGVEHTDGDLLCGLDGESAADYEFWTYPKNGPHPKDSAEYVLNKLERGEEVFNRLKIRPRAWEAPHYAASALDYSLFGKLFEWTYHRPIYFSFDFVKNADLSKNMRMFENLSPDQRLERKALLSQIKLQTKSENFGGQIIPYPVYKDCYGQAVIPETLGFIDYAFFNDKPVRKVYHPSELLNNAKRLKVIRGAFASFFWHPDLLYPELVYYQQHPENFDTEGGEHTLEAMIQGIQNLGYVFKSIGDRSIFPDL
jgi:uncharacterized protein YdaL